MTDAEHDGELRHCMRPDCSESFIVAAYLGEADPGRWRQVNILIGYLCPAHGEECRSGGHAPGWLDRDAPAGMAGIRCGCGNWEWRPAEPSNMGSTGSSGWRT